MPLKKNLSDKEIKTPSKLETTQKTSGCCSTNSPCTTNSPSTPQHFTSQNAPSPTEIKKSGKTRVTIKYDVGFNNSLYIRGKGANLNWEKGISLKNVKSDEWIWETDLPFTTAEFKVLVNDKHYEIGSNHILTCGTISQYTPKF